MEENGRVAFGPHETDTLPPEWAAALLSLLYERHRGTFGALLAEVVTGERFSKKQAPRR